LRRILRVPPESPALTSESYPLIDAPAIEKMKDGLTLVNTARGGLIDSEALLEGLKSVEIGRAGLCVYEEEADSFCKDLSDGRIAADTRARLTTSDNVMVTGHQGAH
jgi:D-lactate dehydrogenase